MRYFAVAGGLLVTSVGEASQAARSGVRAGDVIVSVGDRQVNDLATLLKALDEGGDRPPILAVSRQREQLQMTLAR
jgi:S1-C subfamily serine protease